MLQQKQQLGFTLMEIVVATSIFATTVTMILVLFNYTLKINRRVEQLRQVSQATRNFTEFLVREVRNGTIDYSGEIDLVNCPVPYQANAGATYLALTNRAGDQECFYLGADNNFYLTKRSIIGVVSTERVNPEGVTIDPANFRLFVRPLTDPMDPSDPPGIQPFVTMVMSLTVQLGPADTPTTLLYQTSVSTDDYNILHRL